MKGKNESSNPQINKKRQLLAGETPEYTSCDNQDTSQLLKSQKEGLDLCPSGPSAKFTKKQSRYKCLVAYSFSQIKTYNWKMLVEAKKPKIPQDQFKISITKKGQKIF